MYHFDFYMPAKVLFGEGRLQSLHEEKLPGDYSARSDHLVRRSEHPVRA